MKIKKEKLELYIYGILTMLILLSWVGFEIWFSFHKAEQDAIFQKQQIEWNIRHQKNLKKLKELQIKYKKDIEEEKRVSQIDIFTLNYEDIELLAMNNYYESRGVGKTMLEKRKDMENVTSVVLNRVQSGRYGKTVREVIQGSRFKNGKLICQFSWVCDENRPHIVDSAEWRLAYDVAFEIYSGIQKRSVYRAMHYYNPKKVKPRWAKKAKEVAYVYSGHRVIIID